MIDFVFESSENLFEELLFMGDFGHLVVLEFDEFFEMVGFGEELVDGGE